LLRALVIAIERAAMSSFLLSASLLKERRAVKSVEM
jgi:hypothetical protein